MPKKFKKENYDDDDKYNDWTNEANVIIKKIINQGIQPTFGMLINTIRNGHIWHVYVFDRNVLDPLSDEEFFVDNDGPTGPTLDVKLLEKRLRQSSLHSYRFVPKITATTKKLDLSTPKKCWQHLKSGRILCLTKHLTEDNIYFDDDDDEDEIESYVDAKTPTGWMPLDKIPFDCLNDDTLIGFRGEMIFV